MSAAMTRMRPASMSGCSTLHSSPSHAYRMMGGHSAHDVLGGSLLHWRVVTSSMAAITRTCLLLMLTVSHRKARAVARVSRCCARSYWLGGVNTNGVLKLVTPDAMAGNCQPLIGASAHARTAGELSVSSTMVASLTVPLASTTIATTSFP